MGSYDLITAASRASPQARSWLFRLMLLGATANSTLLNRGRF